MGDLNEPEVQAPPTHNCGNDCRNVTLSSTGTFSHLFLSEILTSVSTGCEHRTGDGYRKQGTEERAKRAMGKGLQ